MIRVTADSNIYVSALQFGGKPQLVLELALSGDIDIAISPHILEETLRVLREKFRLSADEMSEAEGYMRRCAKLIHSTGTLDVVKTDPDDNRVVECAVTAVSEVIVSGDVDLLRLGSFQGIRIVKAADFLAEFESRGR